VSDETIMAQTAWAEARGLGYEGMHAICNVIMNRVAKQSWYGLTPTEVCLKPKQFSCWLKSDPNYPKIQKVTDDDPQYKMALALANDALMGNLPDITNKALNYYSNSIQLPSWTEGCTPCYTIGNTSFYNNIP
jgi:N-acetylmuramoyl-L-alanine amidase